MPAEPSSNSEQNHAAEIRRGEQIQGIRTNFHSWLASRTNEEIAFLANSQPNFINLLRESPEDERDSGITTTPIAPNSGIMETVHGLRSSRAIKSAFMESPLSPSITIGSKQEQGQLTERIDSTVNNLLGENNKWVQDQWSKIEPQINKDESKVKITLEDVIGSYKAGLNNYFRMLNIVQRRKVEVNEDTSAWLTPIDLGNDEYLAKAIHAFTVDYILALRVGLRAGMTPKGAMSAASRVDRFNPEQLHRIQSQYPDIPINEIARVMTYTKNPEEMINRIQNTFNLLKAEFPDVPEGKLRYIAVTKKGDPVETVKQSRQMMDDLVEQFPEINKRFLFDVAYKSSNPVEKIEETIARSQELAEEFPEFDENSLFHVAYGYKSDRQREFLLAARDEITSILEKFPTAPRLYIENAVVYAPQKETERFVAEVVSLTDQLKDKYSKLSYSDLFAIIWDAKSSKGIDPEISIQQTLATLQDLKGKFSDTYSDSLILKAIRTRPNPPQTLEKAKADLNQLQEIYSNIPKQVLGYISIHARDPFVYAAKFSQIYDGLVRNNPDLSPTDKFLIARSEMRKMAVEDFD